MKYFYAVTLLFILTSCQKDEKKKTIDHDKTDWAFYKLNGNVKTITTKSWQLNERLEKEKTMHEDMTARNTDLTFTDEGLLARERSYITEDPIETKEFNGREKPLEIVQYVDNKPFIKTSYEWDTSGKNNTAIIRRNGDNSEIDHVKMEFHADKLAKKTTLSAQNIPTETTAYIYDSKGNVIEEDFYLTSYTIQYKNIYKYDKKNRQISEASYTAAGKKNFETISEYKGNNLTKKYTINAKGETEYSEDFTYDQKGNILTKLRYESIDKSTIQDKFMYDDKGNKVSWQILKNNTPISGAQFSYDSHNNLTSVISTDDKNNVIDKREYTYEYDKKGNWIKKTSRINNTKLLSSERTITYFD